MKNKLTIELSDNNYLHIHALAKAAGCNVQQLIISALENNSLFTIRTVEEVNAYNSEIINQVKKQYKKSGISISKGMLEEVVKDLLINEPM